MPWTREHLDWLIDTGRTLVLSCGKEAKIFRFDYDLSDSTRMAAWAKHFRNHYCSDEEILIHKSPSQTCSEFLLEMKFPSATKAPGPSIRSGDFAEILVADYLMYMRDYWVPRTRYDRKGVPNESTKGSDVLAFKQSQLDPYDDELLVYEVKAKLTPGGEAKLQEAIDHSAKDYLRLAESLYGVKQRLIDRNELEEVEVINRFQDSVNEPYKLKYGAAAVCSDSAFDEEGYAASSTADHPSPTDIELIAICGSELMGLAHKLYEMAANDI